MSRRSKFTENRSVTIIESLRNGCTRQAAAEAVDIAGSTLSEWIHEKASFRTEVLRAEAEAEVRNTAVVQKAADGWEAGTRTVTTKTVFKTRKTTKPDGTVIEEPVALEEVTETQTFTPMFDWRAALEWLKRRRPDEWGDRIDVKQLPDDALVRMLNRAADQRSREAGDSTPAHAANGHGHG